MGYSMKHGESRVDRSSSQSSAPKACFRGCVPAGAGFALSLALCLTTVGCGVQVYDWGGEGRGQAFHVPAGAAMNKSPIVQSWVAYSLARSACKLEMGGDEPSRNDSFECEFRPRRVLAKRWARGGDSRETDEYLDLVERIRQDGLLEEYVWHYFRRPGWVEPEGLETRRFEDFRQAELRWHRPRTRIIGYWSKAHVEGLARLE